MSTAPGGYQPGWVHRLICAKLEQFRKDVEQKRSPRLMLFLPPRSGKSEIASKLFPAWYLGHNPDHEVIACSYALALPLDFSKKIKAVMGSKEYKGIFPRAGLDKLSQATEGWKLNAGGSYVAAGVSGPITGKGAHVLIIDDPVKDAEEADSETVRNKTWSWYGSTARTRLAPGGGILLIMTRWHDDDLAGRLLREERELRKQLDEADDTPPEAYDMLENWEVIDLKALSESEEWWDQTLGKLVYTRPPPQHYCVHLRHKDQALHPERFDRISLLKLKNTLQPRHWSALYQQNPTPDEGEFFRRDMLRFYDMTPQVSHMDCYAAWDLAIGRKQHNDFTVGLIGGLNHHGELYVLDMVRGRMTAQEIAEAILEKALRHRAVLTGIERGQLELAIRPTLDELMRKRKKAITLAEGKSALVPITDKVTRARPAQGMMQQGRVYFPAGMDWAETLVGELLRFPNGVYDDCVDALSWLVRLTSQVNPPPEPISQSYSKPLPSWKDRLRMAKMKNWMAA